MNAIAEKFYALGEPYVAGLFEAPEKGYFYRHALGNARYFEQLQPSEYVEGDKLFPSFRRNFFADTAVRPQFAKTYEVDLDRLAEKDTEAAEIFREFYEVSHQLGGWTHSTPNFRRIVREGLTS
ncbi:MAG: hypothetical protein IKU55_04290, partial [Clostridia bacterium]|nr:hypothetical protein [Clostridia bacterium]